MKDVELVWLDLGGLEVIVPLPKDEYLKLMELAEQQFGQKPESLRFVIELRFSAEKK
jgi:hypothetical protein